MFDSDVTNSVQSYSISNAPHVDYLTTSNGGISACEDLTDPADITWVYSGEICDESKSYKLCIYWLF